MAYRYFLFVLPTRRVWHKAFLGGSGRSLDAPGDSKNASALVGIPLKRGNSGAKQ